MRSRPSNLLLTLALVASLLTTGLSSTSASASPGECNGLAVTIQGTNGDDDIVGTEGPDVIAGDDGDDSIQGFGGDDVICGGNGDDVILGGEGNDTIDGWNGADSLRGDDGDDNLIGWNGNDVLDGGLENDCFASPHLASSTRGRAFQTRLQAVAAITESRMPTTPEP